jgi:hypothetical protein
MTIVDVNCFGNYNGSVTINSLAGGVAPFTYTWIGPGGFSQIYQNIGSLLAGSYALIITDSNGCELTVSAQVSEPDQLEYTTYNVVDESIVGACDGQIWVNVQGGTGNYYYDNSELGSFPIPLANQSLVVNDSLILNLCAGLHSIYITDDNNCQGSVMWGGSWQEFVSSGSVYGCTDSTALNYNTNANVDDGSCIYCNITNTFMLSSPSTSSSCDGFILSSASSSFPITNYNWVNSQGSFMGSSNFISNLCNDAYILTLTDSAGCTFVDTLILGTTFGCTDPLALNYNWVANSDDGSCIAVVYGCTDPQAINYDSLANIDDGSCCLLDEISQIGQDIDGEAAGDRSGWSVSLSSDGGTVAIGAPNNSGNGTYAGHVRIYAYNGSSWNQLGSDINGEAANDWCGWFVSLSSDGNTIAIGAPGNDGNGTNAGHVRIYAYNGSSWNQLGNDIDGEAANDESGQSVSLSSDGNTVAIGAFGNGSYAGHVRIYAYNGSSWNQLGYDIDGEAAGDRSGWSVSLSSDGGTVAIGAPDNSGNGTYAGHVRIYAYNGSSWNQLGNDIDGEAIGNYTSGGLSGWSVSLSSNGGIVAIGARQNNGNLPAAGHVKIYAYNGSSWNQLGNDIDGEAANDANGWSVSLSSDGGTVAIGAPVNDGNGSSSGHVRIYAYNGSSWNQLGYDIDGEAADDWSGRSVSLSSDGGTVAIGAPDNSGNGTYAGHVRIYEIGISCAACMDPLALNYDSTVAYSDSSCIYPVGCTDVLAYNYDANAITDDGSCLYCDLSVNLFVNQNSTPSACDGFIVITSTPTSNSPVSYLWSTGSTQNNLTGLCTGTYTLTVTDAVGCTIDTTINIGNIAVYGCTDPLASNYDPLATIDDGSCTYVTCGPITGVNLTDVIHDRATFNWDNMNSSTCDVDQIRFRYREVGTTSYSTKTMGVPVGSGCNTSNTSKLVLGLTPSTTYEYDFKIWYCNASAVTWHENGSFTNLPLCDNVINVIPTPITTTKTEFCWDSVSTYAFVRLKYRENVPGSSFNNIGGMGVMSPTLCKEKTGITTGLQYRVMWRTWCSPNGGPYRSPQWDGPVLWTQPNSIRVEGVTAINNLEVYPNPSRDVFNVTFTSETKQSIELRVLNLVGEIIFTENLENFEGEYTHSFNLGEYSKGIYFLEIETNNGVINKKLILQ